MHVIDERISAWACTATPDQRRAGPTLDDLGGLDEVLTHTDYFTSGPLLGFLVSAAANEPQATFPSALGDAIIKGLASSTRHLAFAEAVDTLATHPRLVGVLGTKATRTLLRRLTEAQDAGDDPASALIGAEAAECLVQFTLAGVATPAQLLGAMDMVTEDTAALPTAFAARLPRLLGVLDAHHPGAGLREALERCLIPEHTFRDAAFELALGDVRTALEQDNYQAMVEQLSISRRRLDELAAVDPDRLDAQIYLAGIDGLLGLSAPDAPVRVAAAAQALHDRVQNYRAWRMRTSTPAWAKGRQDDITAWCELTVLLDYAAQHMGDDDPWYAHGHGILTALLRAYTAHHTVKVLTDTPAEQVVETLVAPVIEDAFLRSENRFRILEHALTHDEDFRDDGAAQRLHASLSARLRSSALLDPGAEVDPGKTRRWPQLARQFPEDFAVFTDQNSDKVLDRLELALRDSDDFLLSVTDAKYSRLMDTLVVRLEKSRDWIATVAEPFQVLLEATVRFAFLCYDVGRTTGGSYTEYLRGRDKDGKKQKVDEALFHQHYREFLAVTALFRVAHFEVIDKGGGRADVLVTFPAAYFNVECKIEEEDASKDGLRTYVAQAAEYQNAGPSFAILLALDKTVGAEGAINLFDSIWIEEVQRTGELEPCLVVVVRVPGGRENPNRLRPAPRRI
ncbi:hypothetical protein [Streptomyces tubercidicus]|uniref:Uncharacterized protein n=1 Tax=Streptomyces tubercidicus TaxID=47759 RepID=A0A640USN6_9ACTN|nr:hypothetical protein [Streptomyces tubercidicus]WAU13040.1 hypothetical protein STRTU_003481 [Streptomyces tubercidicus]GFE38587.1 hypothetical protein Stube_32600 [Streptomyces tubercidicus]